ncbi:hypothetical protein MTP99_002440 [Tenebrio molitor]|nr:hypothetical protein MTP99_002440 [Tenebrio molitor]
MPQENSEIKICAATRQILRNALIWPKEDEEMNPGKWTYIRILTFVCFTSLLCISTTTHFLLTLENKVERDVSEEMAVLSAIYGTYFMVFAYIKNQKKISKKLTRCILYHSEVLDFAKRLDDCFSSCMFAHLILTSTICACLEKQITGINRFGGVLHILGWIVNLFVSCLAGQRLINANGTIAEAIWASKWYQADVRLQKDVRLMLLRSQRDLHLRAGPFGIVSFALFVSVLKMSYSLLCVLTS